MARRAQAGTRRNELDFRATTARLSVIDHGQLAVPAQTGRLALAFFGSLHRTWPAMLVLRTWEEKVMKSAAWRVPKLMMWMIMLGAGRCSAVGISDPASAAPYKSKQIRVEYVLPKNPSHQPIYDGLKKVRALERIQTLLSPLRLPRPLLLKVSGCDGQSNAWYDKRRLRDRLLRIPGRHSKNALEERYRAIFRKTTPYLDRS